jgi:hypothetical protein
VRGRPAVGLSLKRLQQTVGVDVSSAAVRRARERCPRATFDAGDITKFDQVAGQPSFDLVVGCEVLYYVRDIRRYIGQMSRLGDACFVTYYSVLRDKLDPEISLQHGVKSELIRHGETEWIAAWWMNTHAPSQVSR